MGTQHLSRPRHAGLAESWGSGTLEMARLCAGAGLPAPLFTEEQGAVWVNFPASAETGPGRVGKEVPEKVLEKVLEKATPNQSKILAEAESNPSVTIEKLAAIVGISGRKIRDNIKKLKDKGLIRRVGPDKGGSWEVTAN